MNVNTTTLNLLGGHCFDCYILVLCSGSLVDPVLIRRDLEGLTGAQSPSVGGNEVNM